MMEELRRRLRIHKGSNYRVFIIKPVGTGIVKVMYRDGDTGSLLIMDLEPVEPTLFDVLAFVSQCKGGRTC